ncbi:hypothetical protein FB446DRAFT_793827 [Lentinula raphanica]|nr:hypothetical protein FB446DRAFT_793827 [Lentinula raphanica]
MSSPTSHQTTPQPELTMQAVQPAATPVAPPAMAQPGTQIQHPQTPMHPYYYGPPPPGLPYPPHYRMPPPGYGLGSIPNNSATSQLVSVPGTHTYQHREPRCRLPKPSFELPTGFGDLLMSTPEERNPSPSSKSPSEFPETAKLAANAKHTADERKQKAKVSNNAKTKQSKKEADTNEAAAKHSRGGRTKGASSYGTEELCTLVRLVGEVLPIGQKRWSLIEEKYNKWAGNEGFPERKREPLCGKFKSIVAQAKVKPTGEGERRQMYFDALGVETEINNKSSMTPIQDTDGSESSSGKSENNDNSDDEVEVVSSKVKKKGTVLTKSYKVEAPLPDPSKDEDRSSANVQLVIIQGMQGQINTLTQQLNEERHRADRAESKLRMLEMLHGRGHGSRSNCYSRRDSYSPSPRRRHSHSPTPSPRKRYYQHWNHNVSRCYSPSPTYESWPRSPPSPPYKSHHCSRSPSGVRPHPLNSRSAGQGQTGNLASSSSVPLEALAQLASQIPPVETRTSLSVGSANEGKSHLNDI